MADQEMTRVIVMERVRLLPSFLPPVLNSESASEQAEICRALEQEIKSVGIIDKMYVADIASITFEILRYRRCQIGIINTSFRTALERLIAQLQRDPAQAPSFDGHYGTSEQARFLALKWFTDKAAKKQVSELLSQFELDESAIEAEAVRSCITELERIERLLASLELRRMRALSFVGQYRESLARQLKESSDRIIDAKTVRPRLEDGSGKKTAAA
jgi:hypothetical protein